MIRLNLGCGDDVRPGWVNIDSHPRDGVIVADLDACDTVPLPLHDDSVSEIHASHLIEHIALPLPLLQELWRVAAPDALLTFRCPYGSSDNAWEDPTHVRPYFTGSWVAFSQPYYWRVSGDGNGYGYTADWQPTKVSLRLADWAREAGSREQILGLVQGMRNVVLEMTAVLRAVKPARPADRSLIDTCGELELV